MNPNIHYRVQKSMVLSIFVVVQTGPYLQDRIQIT